MKKDKPRTRPKNVIPMVQKLEPIPNLSGTDESCESCVKICNMDVLSKINRALNAAEPPRDEVLCIATPNAVMKKTWGWCHMYEKNEQEIN